MIALSPKDTEIRRKFGIHVPQRSRGVTVGFGGLSPGADASAASHGGVHSGFRLQQGAQARNRPFTVLLYREQALRSVLGTASVSSNHFSTKG